ncbi:hypothetical protein PR002_g891 [Phytophthora rubi]|uniref:Uncharacterized protein n=1 Tax=Phytophthora rubi TaxID=129364 RepID=A0A6A3NY73_9STRA|nr:hypothetical protein PR002_g891 [Phytophthora rubi]
MQVSLTMAFRSTAGPCPCSPRGHAPHHKTSGYASYDDVASDYKANNDVACDDEHGNDNGPGSR